MLDDPLIILFYTIFTTSKNSICLNTQNFELWCDIFSIKLTFQPYLIISSSTPSIIHMSIIIWNSHSSQTQSYNMKLRSTTNIPGSYWRHSTYISLSSTLIICFSNQGLGTRIQWIHHVCQKTHRNPF